MRTLAAFAILLGLAAPAWAQRQMSVAQLEAFIKSSIQLKHPDKQVADVLDSIRLSDRLDLRAVETLQGLGAGPRTIAKLRELSEASAALPAPVPPEVVAGRPPIPPPSSVEQGRILEQARTNALDYTQNLPDFLCTQVTRRRVDPTGREQWRLIDTIQEQLRYVDGHEEYEVVSVNGQFLGNVTHEQLGGTVTRGEWATMLHEIFLPSTQTEFQWERWGTLRTRRMHVFGFRVRQANSKYGISDQQSGRSMIAGYHGQVYVDQDTKMVMRIRMDADGLQNFPINQVAIELDYDLIDISGEKFVLPIRSRAQSKAGLYMSWNDVEFRRYQKFGTDAVISFELPDELPEDLFEESPEQ